MWFDDVGPNSVHFSGSDEARDHAQGTAPALLIEPGLRWPTNDQFHPFVRPQLDNAIFASEMRHSSPGLGIGWPPIADDEIIDINATFLVASEGDGGEIIVTGTRLTSGGILWNSSEDVGSFEDPKSPVAFIPPPGEDEGEAPSDESTIEVTINLGRPLTDSENEALQDFMDAVAAIDAAIRSLADNVKITLYDGSTVTGAELKSLWSKTEFFINPDNIFYGETNPQNRGAAMLNGGNPEVFVNISTFMGYAAHPNNSGLNYFVGHELGHLTQANQNHNGTVPDAGARYEQMANDISRAIANLGGLAILPQTDAPQGVAYDRYSTPNPLVFTAN